MKMTEKEKILYQKRITSRTVQVNPGNFKRLREENENKKKSVKIKKTKIKAGSVK